MKSWVVCCLSLLANLCIGFSFSSKTFAFGEESFRFDFGASINELNSDVTINGLERRNSADIDLEDDLDFDEKTNLYMLKGTWRFFDRHRISLEYNPLERTAKNTINENIEFKDSTIYAGGFISSKSDLKIYDMQYSYSFFRNDKVEIDVSGGIYWLHSELSLEASALIEDQNGLVLYQEDYRTSVKTDAPLPLVGLALSYHPTSNWQLSAAVRYFEAGIDRYKGDIRSAKLGAGYSFTDHVAVGLSLGRFSLELNAKDSDFSGKMRWNYSALQMFLAIEY